MPLSNSPSSNESEADILPIKEKLITGEICVAGNVVTDGYDQMLEQQEMQDLLITQKNIIGWVTWDIGTKMKT